ncbi:Malto-oligosyltrehalose trehalohydrolase [Salinivirga cyanobacteriivorans]|uniref:Malto-oligosyltrehalose trehalohydrolase n=1 Tax=Salinivirga cyanobacteriivorans TaxID=1307839 RepID=A0A0S2I2G5_9BACT|nr:alpha-amylase family glycosyl hydrolase [Salinivirga cyanobacteriivorans]ALO16389.1 Malto-oligosyltrehalose trehalohydrolase [Salinivirga cyanobacteriivorans]
MQQIIRKISFLTLFITTLLYSNAQVIVTSPAYPTPDQSVTITFNADQGNAALAGYSGDIYAHTGVITSESTSASDWKYVVTEWGENTPGTQLSNISGDEWELTISPSIVDYYGVPQDETILQLAFVFRNEDGSIVGRAADGGDIYANVYSNPYEITWNAPSTSQIYSPGDIIDVDAVSLAAESMELSVNGAVVETANSTNLTYSFEATLSGINELVLNVTAPDSTYADTLEIVVRESTTTAALPSANLKDGINYIDDNTVTLVLYAPFKDFVFVNGSFSDWQLLPENQMYRTPDENRYWITLDNLTAGEEYAFQYIVDGEITIADPYTDKILDPWNDSYITESTYPNLMPYPTGDAEGIVSTFQTAQTPYNWQVENFTRPANEDLVIYELLVRDFVAAHDYQTLIDTINYLKNLGVNAIELMPVSEFEGNSSWGYNPSFYFAPDKYYGTKDDLKEFIDVCHQNGIAVILDMVLNHSYGQSPLVQLYFDPSAGDYGQPTPENPWYNETSPNPTYYWGFDFDHESPETKEFVNRVTTYWLDEYKFDGFRFDFTKGFTNTPGEGWSYDQSRIDILKDIADTIWNAAPGAYVILEHLTENSEEKILAEYGMLLWGNMNYSYLEASMGYITNSDFSGISYKNRSWNAPHLVGYMESHDEERMMFKNITYGNNTAVYDITQEEIALRRAELSTLFFLTVPGPKMIWQFGEMGYDYSIDYDCRVCEKPIRWDYLEEDGRRHLYNFYSQVIELRNSSDLYQTTNFNMDVGGDVKIITLEHNGEKTIIFGNFDVETQTYTPNLSGFANWYSFFEGGTEISGDTTFTLEPGQYRLLTTNMTTTPEWPNFPEARNVYITGDTEQGSTLTANYDYFDLNGDAEGSTEFQWYVSDDASGSGKRPISGATEQDLVLTRSAGDKYLSVVVKPVAQGTEYQTGLPAESGMFGPVNTSLSVQENEKSLPIIYPNPVSGDQLLSIKNVEQYQNIQIVNGAGQILNSFKIEGQKSINIDFTQYQQGFYFIKLQGTEHTVVEKIVKTP